MFSATTPRWQGFFFRPPIVCARIPCGVADGAADALVIALPRIGCESVFLRMSHVQNCTFAWHCGHRWQACAYMPLFAHGLPCEPCLSACQIALLSCFACLSARRGAAMVVFSLSQPPWNVCAFTNIYPVQPLFTATCLWPMMPTLRLGVTKHWHPLLHAMVGSWGSAWSSWVPPRPLRRAISACPDHILMV